MKLVKSATERRSRQHARILVPGRAKSRLVKRADARRDDALVDALRRRRGLRGARECGNRNAGGARLGDTSIGAHRESRNRCGQLRAGKIDMQVGDQKCLRRSEPQC
jgi:hypothetical protein